MRKVIYISRWEHNKEIETLHRFSGNKVISYRDGKIIFVGSYCMKSEFEFFTCSRQTECIDSNPYLSQPKHETTKSVPSSNKNNHNYNYNMKKNSKSSETKRKTKLVGCSENGKTLIVRIMKALFLVAVCILVFALICFSMSIYWLDSFL